MSSNKTILNILISIVVIVAAFFAYRLFFSGGDSASQKPGLVGGNFAVATSSPSDDFLQILLSLKSLDFKTEVFDTIHQNQLRDFTTVLRAQTPGRANPFAPLGVGGQPVGTSTTARKTASSTNSSALNQ